MGVVVRIHLEAVEGRAAWWADVPDAPGYYAAAPSLEELRTLLREGLIPHLDEQGITPSDFIERLVVTTSDTVGASFENDDARSETDVDVATEVLLVAG